MFGLRSDGRVMPKGLSRRRHARQPRIRASTRTPRRIRSGGGNRDPSRSDSLPRGRGGDGVGSDGNSSRQSTMQLHCSALLRNRGRYPPRPYHRRMSPRPIRQLILTGVRDWCRAPVSAGRGPASIACLRDQPVPRAGRRHVLQRGEHGLLRRLGNHRVQHVAEAGLGEPARTANRRSRPCRT